MASRRPATPSFCSTAETWWSTVRIESTSATAISATVGRGPVSSASTAVNTASRFAVGERGGERAAARTGGVAERAEGGRGQPVVTGALQHRGVRRRGPHEPAHLARLAVPASPETSTIEPAPRAARRSAVCRTSGSPSRSSSTVPD
jgi:hypothetical protein